MKSLKILGILILIAATFALGYYWRGRGEITADRADSSHTPAKNEATGDSMAGHDMSQGGVNVSPEKQQMVGIRTAVAEIRPLIKKIRTVGIVAYDETKVAQVFSKVDGWIDRLFVNYTGKLVQKNQPLFTLYSPDLVATQEEYLLALQAKDALQPSSFPQLRQGSTSLLDETVNCSDQSASIYRLWDEFNEFVQDFLTCVRRKVCCDENNWQARPLHTNVGDYTEPRRIGQCKIRDHQVKLVGIQ